MKTRFLLVAAFFLSNMAAAADINNMAQGLDAGDGVQRQGAVVTILASPPRVNPHVAPFTELIPALCDFPKSLVGLEKVIVVNQYAFKGASAGLMTRRMI